MLFIILDYIHDLFSLTLQMFNCQTSDIKLNLKLNEISCYYS